MAKHHLTSAESVLNSLLSQPTKVGYQGRPYITHIMPEVEIKKGEPIDRALKRLKGKMEAEGIMEEMRRLRAFETPAQKAKRKDRASAKKSRNRVRFQMRDPKAGEKKPDTPES